VTRAPVTPTPADSYIHHSATTAGAPAELPAERKVLKYADLPGLETMGPIDESAGQLIEDLVRRISAISSEPREGVFLFQRLSILLQRFNNRRLIVSVQATHPVVFSRLI